MSMQLLKSIFIPKRYLLIICLVIITVGGLQPVKAQPGRSDENSVYQYAVPVGSKQAWLWIPPHCKQVKGIILSFSNLLERNWLENPIIRKEAERDNLAIILIQNSADGITPELNTGAQQAFLKMLKDMALGSGYPEIEYAPFIPIDHSVFGSFTWNLANWLPERTIAIIPVKTFALPATVDFHGIPLCYFVGETDEWPPVKDGRPWRRDFIWPQIRGSAVELRTANENNLISVVTDPGGGHLDWSDKLSTFMALYIHKACQYRIPKTIPTNTFVKLNKITPQSGWLTDTAGLDKDKHEPAPYKKYTGDPKKAYCFFDEETAKAAVAFAGDRLPRKKQMLTFVQNNNSLSISKQGFVNLQFIPEQDGITFNIKGDFLSAVPAEFTDAGTLLGHADGDIKFHVITGPAVQVSPGKFVVQFNRSSPGGDIWIQEEQAGDAVYNHAVQPGQIKLPAKLTIGKSQAITFNKIADQKAGVRQINLSATSDSDLPVRYYVVCGPAIVDGNILKITDIPVKSRYPVKVTLVAYQWGRITEPLYQSAELVTQSFLIVK